MAFEKQKRILENRFRKKFAEFRCVPEENVEVKFKDKWIEKGNVGLGGIRCQNLEGSLSKIDGKHVLEVHVPNYLLAGAIDRLKVNDVTHHLVIDEACYDLMKELDSFRFYERVSFDMVHALTFTEMENDKVQEAVAKIVKTKDFEECVEDAFTHFEKLKREGLKEDLGFTFNVSDTFAADAAVGRIAAFLEDRLVGAEDARTYASYVFERRYRREKGDDVKDFARYKDLVHSEDLNMILHVDKWEDKRERIRSLLRKIAEKEEPNRFDIIQNK